MNRLPVAGHQINRVQCDHAHCLELHALRGQAVKLRAYNTLNRIEWLLSLCPNQKETR